MENKNITIVIIMIIVLLLVGVIVIKEKEHKEVDVKEDLLKISYNVDGNETKLNYDTENPVVALYVKDYGSWQLQAKIHSNLYRLNSTPIWLAKAHTLPSHDCDGYEPQYGNLADTAIINFTNFEINEIQVNCFKEIIETCNKNSIKLIIYIAPSLEVTAKFQKWMKDFCEEQKVMLNDFGCSPMFFSNRHLYFNDSDHLNDTGAHRMTNRVIADINTLLK